MAAAEGSKTALKAEQFYLSNYFADLTISLPVAVTLSKAYDGTELLR